MVLALETETQRLTRRKGARLFPRNIPGERRQTSGLRGGPEGFFPRHLTPPPSPRWHSAADLRLSSCDCFGAHRSPRAVAHHTLMCLPPSPAPADSPSPLPSGPSP